MTDEERMAHYKGMTDHDLLINIATRVDGIEATCRSRANCGNNSTRKYLAIGAGIGAGITGIGEGIKRWLLGG